jgi:hypothetical protein
MLFAERPAVFALIRQCLWACGDHVRHSGQGSRPQHIHADRPRVEPGGNGKQGAAV